MTLNILYTDRGTIIVKCGEISTEVPLAPPATQSPAPHSESPTEDKRESAPAQVPEPRPQPIPATIPSKTGARPTWSTSRPKHGPRVMIIRPIGDDAEESPGDFDLFASEDQSIERLTIDFETLRSHNPDTLLSELRRNATPSSFVVSPMRLSVLDVRVSRTDMKKGVSTDEFKSLFSDRNNIHLDGVRLLWDFDANEE